MVGDKISYHNPLGRKNKLAANSYIGGTVIEKQYRSVFVRLNDGKVIRAALKNVKKIF